MSTRALLTGIAALFLATGAAHAGAERECPAKRLADGNWNEIEVQECKARVNKAVNYTGHWVWRSPPPPEFDKPYDGVLVIYRLPLADVQKICTDFGQNKHACSFVKQVAHFRIGDRVTCFIMMPPDDVIDLYREDPKDIIRHETGHCNGWPLDHPNRQTKWEWVEK
jgi:hypothetical protein